MQNPNAEMTPPEEGVGKKATKAAPAVTSIEEVKQNLEENAAKLAEQEPKPKAKAKAKAKGTGTRRSKFADLYPDNAKVELLVKENPKKPGSKSFTIFEGYTGADTIGKARTQGVTYQSIAYDVGRNFIKVTPAE